MADGTMNPRAQAASDRVPSDSAPNKRQLAKAATRQKVLDAGKALFEADGYEAATIRAIAARAGMSTGAVFANFDDKRALYIAVYGHAPLTPEQGRALMLAGRKVITAKSADWNSADFDEQLNAAYDEVHDALASIPSGAGS